MYIPKIKQFQMDIEVDSDKSITHRALILGAIARGSTRIFHPSDCDDCISTLDSLNRMGVKMRYENENVIEVFGGIEKGEFILDAGNSGTTARLLTGMMAGRANTSIFLNGDKSLCMRPMRRIITPLEKMGAEIYCHNSEGHLPLEVKGKKLNGIEYELPIPSAQLKSALLLAGIQANGNTVLSGELDSRNHTELLLREMNADIREEFFPKEIEEDMLSKAIVKRIILHPSELKGVSIDVAGDFSSAVYFLVLCLLKANSRIIIRNVNINSTRIAMLELLKSLGGKIALENIENTYELKADIHAEFSTLSPFRIDGKMARKMIDELPLLAVVACFIEGDSTIEGAEELRHKESDRIEAIVEGINQLGGDIDALDDGMIIRGKGRLRGTDENAENDRCAKKLKKNGIATCGDHRIEMSLVIAAMLSDKGAEIETGNASISFPRFYNIIKKFW